MKESKLNDMTKGWFVGNFVPTLYKTTDCEIAYKIYKKGDFERKHYHKIATEITLITKGKVKMFGKIYSEGDIVIIEPEEATSFEAMEETANVVVKIPGVNNDKYFVGE
ncbi:MAG: hypothetical protein LIO50_05800 [Phascolarctobacterium sp.]|uniref:hypothetical protein n=1 Tax=Phascolarctobacterium sp. TaxID=2049039 RepID=UPI0025CFB73B|nr:hypothetical protein [Phascolarctobacterium sp.]MCC8158717.1 hypothetical protein [Phascolarctobacterium sp.]